MRISGEERRAIAKKLRYTANDDLGGLSLQKNLAAITKAEDGSWRGVMRRLADLMDRPTCRNVYNEICDEYEGAVAKTASSAVNAARSSRITRVTASRGRSIAARSASERWWTDGRNAHMRPLRQANAEL